MGQNNSTYHIPVLRDACIEGLAINPDGVYVDVTFGGGGHSRGFRRLTFGTRGGNCKWRVIYDL